MSADEVAVPMGNGWARSGACEPERCQGRCCTFVALFFERTPEHEQLLAGYHARGLPMQIATGDRGEHVNVRIEHRCQHLTDEGRCAIYEDRPQVCRDFPRHPADLITIEEHCGFRFEPAAAPLAIGG